MNNFPIIIKKIFPESQYDVYFDKTYKKFILLSATEIKIFDSKGNLLQNYQIDLVYPINSTINSVSISKDNLDILILFSSNSSQILYYVDFVSLKKIKILTDKNKIILGSFFLTNQNYFFLICKSFFSVFYINKENKNVLINEKKIISTAEEKKKEVIDFIYNKRFDILAIIRKNYSIILFDLKEEKNFDKDYNIKLDKDIDKLNDDKTPFNFKFFKESIQKEKETNTKIFFSDIYDKLYFFIFNENHLFLFHLLSLDSYYRHSGLVLQNDSKDIFSIQIVDNLILIHNITKKVTTMHDIKLKANQTEIGKFYLEEIIYNKENAFIHNIAKIKNEFYMLSFSCENFSKIGSNIYETLFILMFRKNSKEIIICMLIQMIKDSNKINLAQKVIYLLIERFFKKIKKEKEIEQTLSIQKSTKLGSKVNKYFISFKDIANIFLKEEILSLNPDYVLNILLFFIHDLIYFKVDWKPFSLMILIKYIINVQNLNKLYVFFHYSFIPDDSIIAKFLIENFKQSNNISLFQIGIDILKRMKKYSDIICCLLQNEMHREAALFIKKEKLHINFRLLKKNIKENYQISRKTLISFRRLLIINDI